MRNFGLYWFSVFFLCPLLLIAQSDEKVVGKSFNLYGKNQIELDLGDKVTVKKWSESIARVEMSIQITNGNNSLLKALVTTGRYNIKDYPKGNVMILHVPALSKQVNFRGTILDENIQFTVFVPQDVEVVNPKQPNPSSANK